MQAFIFLGFLASFASATEWNGIILDPARAGLGGADVLILQQDGRKFASMRTAQDGRFHFSLPPGDYEIRVQAAGFRTESRRVRLTESSPQFEFLLQLEDKRDVVTVTESAGYLIAAAAALKSPVALINVPQSVTVVTGSQIRDLGMQNMADVVRYVPGITMAQGEGHRDAPVIRGNATTADFYVNGVRDDVQYFRDLYNVDRVEAVKGANALTFGRGGGGGVINRVTKQAEFTPLREISLQGGSFGNRRFSTDYGRSFRDRIAFRLNGMYENSDSFRHDVNLERYGVAPALSVKAGERTLLRFGYEYFNDGRTVDRGVPSFNGLPSPAHRSTFFATPPTAIPPLACIWARLQSNANSARGCCATPQWWVNTTSFTRTCSPAP